MEQITIAAIEGFCIGGGVALAVALDFRVMARDAHMRVPEIGLGMNMSWQSMPRMLHLMGPARTKQAVILADQRISAAEAYEWGLVEEVADPGKAFDAAMALAAKVAAQPPISVAMTKLTVNRLAHALDDLAGHMDVDQFALASLTEDHKEGVEASCSDASRASGDADEFFYSSESRRAAGLKSAGDTAPLINEIELLGGERIRAISEARRVACCPCAYSCARPAQNESPERLGNSR